MVSHDVTSSLELSLFSDNLSISLYTIETKQSHLASLTMQCYRLPKKEIIMNLRLYAHNGQ